MVHVTGLMALKLRIVSPALILAQLAPLCVAIETLANSSIHVLTVSVHIHMRRVFKAGTTMDGLIGEIRAQILPGGIQRV